MVNLTNDEFAVIKAILQTVSDNCNYYWKENSLYLTITTGG